jgi:very-short-patch-repair endonuclease
MTDGAQLIHELLTYIEQVEKLKTKPAFSVPTEYFAAYQYELKGLPGLQFNSQVGGDDVWLRVPRLRENLPPSPGEKLTPWVTFPKSLEKTPELRSEPGTRVGKQEISHEQLDKHPELKALFAEYLQTQWEPWAAAERPRRRTIARYNQLFSLQQVIASEGAETALELVWGMGVSVWKNDGYPTAVRYPLVVQSCEITLNEKTFGLEIQPRDVEPRLEVDCYSEMGVSGLPQLEVYWKSALVTGVNRANPFEESTFEGICNAAVGYLDPSGAYVVCSDDVAPPAPADTLRVTNTWVLFARKRSGDIFLEDIRRLKKRVEEAKSLPAVIRSLVEIGDSEVRARPEQCFRGLSSSDSPPGALELYFPKPYNDEQVSIVQKLHTNDGVVVQGPPGTGKTHTIANVICHYLAQGKRVLVTAKSETALAVLREQLPERIQPLSVALLSDEREGMRQFEHSIQKVATTVAAINPTTATAKIANLELRLNDLHAKISNVDQKIAAYASKHMQTYSFQGREVTPEDMAKLIVEQAQEHQWFDDDVPPGDDVLPFDESHIGALRQARIKVGEDLAYLNCSLPNVDEFPAWSDLLSLHRDLVRAKAIQTSITNERVIALVDSTQETFAKAKALLTFLEDRAALKAKITTAKRPWFSSFVARLAGVQQSDPALQALLQTCTDVQALETRRRQLLAQTVVIPGGIELNQEFTQAVERLAGGKSAFSLPFGKADTRKLLDAVKVRGATPRTKDDWQFVTSSLRWCLDARAALSRWNPLAGEFGVELAGTELEPGFRAMLASQVHIENLRRLAFEFGAKLQGRLEEVFARGTSNRLWDGGEPFISLATESLKAHLDKGRLGYAMHRVSELLQKLEKRSGGVVNEIHSFLSMSMGRAAADEAVLQTTWIALQAELSRLTSLRPSFDQISLVSEALRVAGASKWAHRVQAQPASADHDPFVPARWYEAWNWRKACMFLDRIEGHEKLRQFFEARRTLTASLSTTYQDLVAEKTWLEVFKNSPDSVRQALQAYLNAVQAMGSGTGIRAIRHRKSARDAMVRAYRAVPCWVLPQWRVSETIPPELELFDLVVIDEASQADIWALPALLRGKKILVVGDHKQVSPSAVGMAEARIVELTRRFLANQPHGADMTPDKSIYDLAKVVFAGNSVMLKEHFRCVPAIIEFSNREFYSGDIKPLRLPKANERLDPPLVDVFVKGGARNGDTNPAEAKAIVDEIEAILADSQFDGKSIGVVTLLGNNQASLIQDLISKRISPLDVVARKITAGQPTVFQGRERDIMLVSMVLAPGDNALPNRPEIQQRFNVALSRARDRMYLFRSVPDGALNEASLNARVMRHFKKPFVQDARRIDALRERCQSPFEREMFDELVKRNYRVEPQVPCGAYRIDFVVEGGEGRRLAVECDGDRFHGPGQWSDDMARQRVLERAGWTFWRCFASSFVRRKEEVLADLLKTLDGLGIEALGAESVDNTVWVFSKEVDPYGVEQEETAA